MQGTLDSLFKSFFTFCLVLFQGALLIYELSRVISIFFNVCKLKQSDNHDLGFVK